MKVMVAAKNRTHMISRCYHQCPYFDTEDMEHLMVCNHPDMRKAAREAGDPYIRAIISHPECDTGFPAKCPLNRHKDSVTTKILRFLGMKPGND